MTIRPLDRQRAIMRVRDMLRAIREIRSLLNGKIFEFLLIETVTNAALERFLEIISEASRSIPDDWKLVHGADIKWRQVADLGNVIRHKYDRVDPGVLWEVYERDLDPLQLALEAMIRDFGDTR
jgi:uncharacterized protein with HEPN domain